MEARYLKRMNDEGTEERFYPITHANAVIDLPKTAEDVGARPDTWMPTAEDVGAITADDLADYLPLDGSVAMSGGLTIKNEQPIIYLKDTASGRQLMPYMYSGVAYIRNQLNSNNRVTLQLSPETYSTENLLYLSTVVSGTSNRYKIFGEHNKELLASTLETLIANGGMSTLQSAIQITNGKLWNSGETFSGTGKGKLFISHPQDSYKPSVTIDGVNIGTIGGHGESVGSTVEIEFLQSFTVTSGGAGSTAYSTVCNAVFY